jgi:succinyl-CoA synthetase beta subunit
LSTVDGFAMLRDYGIATAKVTAVDSEGGALAAGQAIGYPVVLKTDEAIAHKTDVGGVATGLDSGAELAAAYRAMAARLGPKAVVCEQVSAGTEVLLGAVRDPNLGMILLVGAGGILVEQVADRAASLPPVSRSHAAELIRRTTLHSLLANPRGREPADLDAVASAIAGFSALLAELGEDLDAIEINPLLCSAAGAIAVDVYLELRSP